METETADDVSPKETRDASARARLARREAATIVTALEEHRTRWRAKAGTSDTETVTPLLFTRTVAADLLGVSPACVYALAVRGELAFVELPSRGGRRRGRMMFRSAELEEFINRNTKDHRS